VAPILFLLAVKYGEYSLSYTPGMIANVTIGLIALPLKACLFKAAPPELRFYQRSRLEGNSLCDNNGDNRLQIITSMHHISEIV